MEFFSNVNFQFYLAAFLIGGIPFGVILGHFFAGVDVKSSGSKSIGATNVLRVVGEKDPQLARRLAIITLVLDAFKGLAVLLISEAVGVSEATQWGIAVLAVFGHCFSPYLWFEGGKGVATGLGVMAFMLPYETLAAAVVWAVLAKTLKISSISSLGGIATLLAASFIIHPEMAHSPVVMITFILFYKHIPNLFRLFAGEEKPVV